MLDNNKLKKVIVKKGNGYLIPKEHFKGMNVDGFIFADERIIDDILKDNAARQVVNVANLPSIVFRSMAMPDIHWGYGFPIGGVAGFLYDGGIISPGGVGYDINCGVRLLKTSLMYKDVKFYLGDLINKIYKNVPSGVGSEGKIKVDVSELNSVLKRGIKWAIDKGFAWEEDADFIEEEGSMEGVNTDFISLRAKERGKKQIGSLGAGNHFIEIQMVDGIYDQRAKSIFGLEEGQITVMIHTGSRGLGYQVCDDYVKMLNKKWQDKYTNLPDRELVYADISSLEGKRYFSAMKGASNFAWVNRQLITHWIRASFENVLGKKAYKLGMNIIYDIAHNIAKIESHNINGKNLELIVHRKGATRAFGPNREEIPKKYRTLGQPVIIPGDMGTASYLLVGTETAMNESLGSTCHGAGRVLSRHAAIKHAKDRDIKEELAKEGIYVRAKSKRTLKEEMPEAYKDIDIVVDIAHKAGISKKIARLIPLGVVKG